MRKRQHTQKRFMSFNTVLFLSYTLLIILPILVIGLFLIGKNARDTQQNQMQYLQKYNSSAVDSVDGVIQNAGKTVRMQFADEAVLDAVESDSTSSGSYIRNSHIIEQAINDAFLYNIDIRGVHLVNLAHQYFEVSYTLHFRDWIKQNLWELGEEARATENHSRTVLYQEKDGSVRSILSVLFLRDINRNRDVGYAGIEVGLSSINNMLEKNRVDGEYIILMDQEKNVILNSGFQNGEIPEKMLVEGRKFCERLGDGQNSSAGYITADKTRYMIAATQSPLTDWIVLSCMRTPPFRISVADSILVILLVFIAASLCDFLVSMYFSRRLTNSINSLCRAIDSCKDGDIRTVVVEESMFENEIATLLRSYNQLAARLRAQAEREYKQMLHEKMMSLKMLQAQINPHFLYNSLNVVSSIANIHQIDSIQVISNNIAGMLRYSIKSPPLVKIRDELQQICRYVEIQQIRIPGKILLNMDVADDILDIPCPVFTLQPIVENAINHGIEMTGKQGVIQIYGYQDGEDVYMIVSDNGGGMPEETLDMVRNTMMQDMSGELLHESIGLGNVCQRINLYYGSAYGLEISSGLGEGTSVKVHISVRPTELNR